MSIIKLFSSAIFNRNKRSETRQNTFCSATVKYQNQELIATVLNYSETGLGMLIGKPLAANEPIEITLSGRTDQPVTIKADIKRCYHTGNDYMLGVHTTTFDEAYVSCFDCLFQPLRA